MARFRPGGLGGGVGGFAAGDNFLFCFPLLFGDLKQASISQSPPRLLGRSPCVTRPPCRCRKLWGTFFLAPPTPLRATSDSTLPIQLGPPRSLTPPGQDPPSINNVPSRTAAPHPGCSFPPPPTHTPQSPLPAWENRLSILSLSLQSVTLPLSGKVPSLISSFGGL